MIKGERATVSSSKSWFLIVFLLFPYNAVDIKLTAIIINVLAVAYIVNTGTLSRATQAWWLGLFSAWLFAHTSYALMLSEYPTPVLLSQVNHFWQFLLLLLALVFSMQDKKMMYDLLNSTKFQSFLLLSVTISFTFAVSKFGYVHEFAPNSLMLLFIAFFSERKGIAHSAGRFLVIIGLILVFVAADRFSPVFVLLVTFLCWLLTVNVLILKSCAIFIILSPLLMYLSIDPNDLAALITVDHNTYIRAEFVRAAFQELGSNLFMGMGFGPSYRPVNFGYLTDHRLLTDADALNTVSNHHSIFDTAYRLGAPAALFITWAFFILPRFDKRDQLAAATLLVLALGLSLNAWLENQTQMPMVAMLVSIVSTAQSSHKQLGDSKIHVV